MYMKKMIYLAGGCFWGTEKYLGNLKGVIDTEVGFANGKTEKPSYEQVCRNNTGHAEAVRVQYDGEIISLSCLLRLFFQVIDATSLNRQGHDKGTQYRTGIYYTDLADEPVIKNELAILQDSCGSPVVVECLPLSNFYDAEEYHQDYLDKNPAGYCHIDRELIERARSAKVWTDKP
jgi:methionine-S-sulfoxide reductase